MAKLTKAMAEGAKGPEVRVPGDRKRWVWLGDDEVPGFGLRVYGSGRKVFALRYRTRAGRSRTLRLGAFGELTVQQARKMARKEKVRVLEGEDPQAERQRDAVSIETVGVLLTRWLEDYATAHRRRWKEDQSRVERHIRPALGKLRLEDLTRDKLASWHRQLGKSTPVEANRCVETLRAAWRWADAEDLLPEGSADPTRQLRKFRERSRDRWLKEDEVRRLMKATEAEEDPWVRAAVPLFLLTGLRRRELLGARWSDLDLERGEIRLPQTKTGVAQIRSLEKAAVQILRELPRVAESPYVFPSPVDPSKPRDGLKKPWERIRTAAGLEDITLHDLRRTAGSHMAQAGVPLQVIAEVLGHSHPGVTKLYARLASENEREALRKLADTLSPALGLMAPAEAVEQGTLSDSLRRLLDEAGDDPEALAVGLERLGLGSPIRA